MTEQSAASSSGPSPARPERSGGGGGGRGMAGRLAPLVPIVLAVGVALVVRYYPKGAPPTGEKTIIGTKAPDFSLRDCNQPAEAPLATLSLLTDKSPVLIVFFRSYSCHKCAEYLARIAERLDEFKRAGLQVIAICPDSAANLRDSIETYGGPPFPLLSDRQDNEIDKTSRAFGMQDAEGSYLYGVFIVDQERRIQFVDKGDDPYQDFDKLLDIGRKLQKTR